MQRRTSGQCSTVYYMTGTTTAMALLAGVLGAQRTGTGRDIDISLFDVALAQLTYPAPWFLNAGPGLSA